MLTSIVRIHFVFVAAINYKNIFTMKISRFMVILCTCVLYDLHTCIMAESKLDGNQYQHTLCMYIYKMYGIYNKHD